MAYHLTINEPCKNEKNETIPVGTKVEYVGHLPGGNVQVKWDDVLCIINPLATKELA